MRCDLCLVTAVLLLVVCLGHGICARQVELKFFTDGDCQSYSNSEYFSLDECYGGAYHAFSHLYSLDHNETRMDDFSYRGTTCTGSGQMVGSSELNKCLRSCGEGTCSSTFFVLN